MTNTKTTIKSFLTRISVMLIFLVNVEASLVNSALGEIAKQFPGTDPVLISMISTVPTIACLILALVMGKAIAKFNKKHLVLVALAIYTLGGVGGYFFSGSILQILICRAVLGVGAGMTAVLCGSIIAQLYTGNERAHMFGLTGGVDSLMGVLITMLGGALMMIKWKDVFLAYLVFIVIFIFSAYALPSLPPTLEDNTGNKVKVKYNKSQKIKLFLIALYVFCNLLGGMLILLKCAIYITVFNIGTPLFIASVMSAFTFCTMISAFFFGFINKFLKRYTLIVTPCGMIIAYLILILTRSPSAVFVAMIIAGLGNGVFVCSMQEKTVSIGTKEQGGYAMSVVFSALYLGSIAGGFVEKVIGLFGDPTVIAIYIFGASFLALIVIAYVVYTFIVPSNDKPVEKEVIEVT